MDEENQADDGDPVTHQKTYTVVLNSKPHGTKSEVIINLANASSLVTVNPTRLTFNANNWNTPQTVTVTGVNDLRDNTPDKRTTSIGHTVSAPDTDYASEDAEDVSVDVIDHAKTKVKSQVLPGGGNVWFDQVWPMELSRGENGELRAVEVEAAHVNFLVFLSKAPPTDVIVPLEITVDGLEAGKAAEHDPAVCNTIPRSGYWGVSIEPTTTRLIGTPRDDARYEKCDVVPGWKLVHGSNEGEGADRVVGVLIRAGKTSGLASFGTRNDDVDEDGEQFIVRLPSADTLTAMRALNDKVPAGLTPHPTKPSTIVIYAADESVDAAATRWWDTLPAEGKVQVVYGEVKDPDQKALHMKSLDKSYGENHATANRIADEPRAVVGMLVGDLLDTEHSTPAEAWWNSLGNGDSDEKCRLRRAAVGDGNEMDMSSHWCEDWTDLTAAQQADVTCVCESLLGHATVPCHVMNGTGSNKTGEPKGQGGEESTLPEVSVSAATGVTEGGDIIFIISADPAPTEPLGVKLTVSQAGDYISAADAGGHTVTVPTGGTAIHIVATIDDETDETDGSVTATLSAGTGYTISSSSGTATVAVADNDDAPALPVVSVTAGSGVTEGGNTTFTITASPAPKAALTVKLTVSQQGSYIAAGDAGATMVVVPTGGTATYTVATIDDETDETDGSVTATLSAGTGYTISSSSGTATVAVADNDDAPALPVVSVTAGSGVTEGGNTTFTITASPAPKAALTVKLTVSQQGSYIAAGDAGATMVVVPTGGTATYTVATIDDETDETDGSVTATLSAGTGYTISSSSGTATVAVADNDDAPAVAATGLTLVDVTANSVKLAWPANADSDFYVLIWYVPGDDSQEHITTQTSFEITGLEPDTDYDAIVIAQSGDGFIQANWALGFSTKAQ